MACQANSALVSTLDSWLRLDKSPTTSSQQLRLLQPFLLQLFYLPSKLSLPLP